MKTRLNKIVSAATLGLALAFTFSCSSDDGGGFNYGSLPYQGKTYKTIKIGEQTWMAENLNYEVEGSRCYNDDPANCNKYGRLYNLVTAMSACPHGWHLPSKEEWSQLIYFAGGYDVAGLKLKATSCGGTDDYGFAALMGGEWWRGEVGFDDVGSHGLWWTSTMDRTDYSYYMEIQVSYKEGVNARVYSDIVRSELRLFSVRCVQD